MKRLVSVICTMVVVAVAATWMLGKYHTAVPLHLRILIALGGAILSGVLAFILSKQDVDRVDTTPNNK